MANYVPVTGDLQTLFYRYYNPRIQVLLQQEDSRLRAYTEILPGSGTAASPVNQLAPIVAQQVTTRFALSTPMALEYTRRWYFPLQFKAEFLVSQEDVEQSVVDPKGTIGANAVMAFNRQLDT